MCGHLGRGQLLERLPIWHREICNANLGQPFVPLICFLPAGFFRLLQALCWGLALAAACCLLRLASLAGIPLLGRFVLAGRVLWLPLLGCFALVAGRLLPLLCGRVTGLPLLGCFALAGRLLPLLLCGRVTGIPLLRSFALAGRLLPLLCGRVTGGLPLLGSFALAGRLLPLLCGRGTGIPLLGSFALGLLPLLCGRFTGLPLLGSFALGLLPLLCGRVTGLPLLACSLRVFSRPAPFFGHLVELLLVSTHIHAGILAIHIHDHEFNWGTQVLLLDLALLGFGVLLLRICLACCTK